jgi:hypothetical protein
MLARGTTLSSLEVNRERSEGHVLMPPRPITGRLPGHVYSPDASEFRMAAAKGFSLGFTAPANTNPGSLIGSTEILVSVQALLQHNGSGGPVTRS